MVNLSKSFLLAILPLLNCMAIYNRGGGSSFTLVRQVLQTWTYMCGKQGYLQDLENMMYKSYCAKHNQHAKHANARGSGGMPPRKFLKNRCYEIEFGSILSGS